MIYKKRDIKPENFLVDELSIEDEKISIALTDFGVAKTQYQTMTQTGGIGTIQYMAPEVQESGKQSYEVDVWSSGVILYQLLSGDLDSNIIGISMKIGVQQLANELERKIKENSSIERENKLIEIMKEMVQFDASERITPEKALKKLNQEE